MTCKNTLRAVFATAALALAAHAGAATAMTTIWQPTDNNVNLAGAQWVCSPGYSCAPLGVSPSGIEFGLFAATSAGLDTSHYLPIAATGDQVTFAQQGSDWVLTNHAGDTLTLSSKRFSLGASGDNGSTWIANTGQFQHGTAPNWYYAQFGNLTSSSPLGGTGQVLLDTADVSAVPAPAAVWLFGSGLIGMVAVAKRSAKRRG
ncbi:MAG: hypothetical protein WCC36_10370 [Gammaproteobacteria bacterium]